MLNGIPPFNQDKGDAGDADTASRSNHYHGCFVRRRAAFAVPLWHVPGWYYSGFSFSTSPFGVLVYVPIHVSHDQTFIGIGIYVSAAAPAGKLARIGLYESVGGFPTALSLDAGTVPVDSTGEKIVVISHALEAGPYWLAFVCDHIPTLGSPNASLAISPAPTGFSGGGVLGGNVVNTAASGQYATVAGGLPDPAPTPDSTYATDRCFVALRS